MIASLDNIFDVALIGIKAGVWDKIAHACGYEPANKVWVFAGGAGAGIPNSPSNGSLIISVDIGNWGIVIDFFQVTWDVT